MPKKSLKTGIIGLGKVAHIHAAALQKLPQSEFVAVCSRNPEKTKEFAKQYGVVGYIDLETLISESGVEVLLVCTPHPTHKDVSVVAAKAGIHLLIEKPLASSLEDCDDIIEAVETGGGKLGMVSQRRFFEPCLRVKQAIDDGKIGDPILGFATILGWRDEAYYNSDTWRGSWDGEGGGVLVNQAPHQLDLLLWYMGELEEIFAYWGNLNHPYIEVEDTAVAVAKFKNGGLANIVLSNSFNPAIQGKVQVLGSNGACVSVQTDGGQMFVAGMSKIEEPPFNDIWTVPGESDLREDWEKADGERFAEVDPINYYHRLQIEDFLDSIIKYREPLADGLAGRRVVELFTAIYRSKRDKAPIKFPLKPERDRNDFDGRSP